MAQPRTLLVTVDSALEDDVLRIAATVGVEVHVEADLPTLRRCWSAAPAVLIGTDLVDVCAAAGLPRRSKAAVLSRGPAEAHVWQHALSVGAEHVLVLPDAEAVIVDVLADAADGRGARAVVVGIIGGRGGAGASTLAAALALTGVGRGYETLLVDADPLAGGIDLLLGREADPGLRWPDLADSRGRISTAALTAALPRPHGLMVLSWDRRDLLAVPSTAMSAVLAAAGRAADLVVVDLPRRPDEAATIALAASALVLLVVPAEVRACAAASRIAALVAPYCCDVRLVIRGPAPGGVTAPAIAQVLRLPVAGELRTDRRLPGAQERGEPPALRGQGALAELCTDLLAVLVPTAGPARRPTRRPGRRRGGAAA